MSLLDDNYRIRTGDPDRDAQISRGLLMAGLQLMGSRGRLLPALGQAGMAGVQASDQTAQMQQARQMQQMQQQMGKYALAEKKREADLAALPGQFYRPPSAPAIDATGGMETAVEAPNNASGPGGMDYAGLLQAYMSKGALPQAAQIQALMAKPKRELKEHDPTKDLYYQGDDGNPVFIRPGKAKPATGDLGVYEVVAQQYKDAGKVPPTIEQWDLARKRAGAASTHVATYGSPTPVQFTDPKTGQTVSAFAQFGNRPGAPPQIAVVTPDQIRQAAGGGVVPLKPAPSGEGKDPTEFQSKAALYFKSMNQATGTLDRLEASGRTDIKPSIAEMAAPAKYAEFARGQGRKAYVQAQMQWIDSINRVRSGANLPEIEYERAVATFFPTAGDGIDQIRQKAAARKQEEEAMRVAAGRAMPQTQQPSGDDPLGLRSK